MFSQEVEKTVTDLTFADEEVYSTECCLDSEITAVRSLTSLVRKRPIRLRLEPHCAESDIRYDTHE